ncbi:MAG: DinB family protein, partial [Thermodesulfobacteriota bacterium]
FKGTPDYLAKREFLDRMIRAFALELTEKDLEGRLKYIDSRGTEHERNLGGLILHMFNHQTHHRGMVSVYLEMLGIDNDYSNLLYLV